MALSARPIATNAAPSASTGRIPSGARHIASMGDTPIDEISASADLQANTAFNFHGFSEWAQNQNQQQPDRQPLTNTSSNFETFSSTFISLLDINQNQSSTSSLRAAGQQAASPNFITKAIRAYEGTAAVIHGQTKNLGNSLSISL
ncbi:MAG: hypothetical protein COB46_10620 [Rhodospirillaceae bacterium]|nr:MAG: hypothetical protein COB46_10620 [Rhodospirillaceae bacterium]